MLAGAAQVEPEAGAHVVHREQGAVPVAERTEAVEEARRRRGPGLVIEGSGHDQRDLARMCLEARAQPVEVVPGELEQLVAVVRGDAGQMGQRPRPCRVVRAADPHDARPSGVGPRHVDRPAGRVRPVLAEHREVGARRERDQALGQLDHARPR